MSSRRPPAIPPTRFGPGSTTAQAKPAGATPAQGRAIPPPPTRFGAPASAQAKAVPPPIRLAAATTLQAMKKKAGKGGDAIDYKTWASRLYTSDKSCAFFSAAAITGQSPADMLASLHAYVQTNGGEIDDDQTLINYVNNVLNWPAVTTAVGNPFGGVIDSLPNGSYLAFLAGTGTIGHAVAFTIKKGDVVAFIDTVAIRRHTTPDPRDWKANNVVMMWKVS